MSETCEEKKEQCCPKCGAAADITYPSGSVLYKCGTQVSMNGVIYQVYPCTIRSLQAENERLKGLLVDARDLWYYEMAVPCSAAIALHSQVNQALSPQGDDVSEPLEQGDIVCKPKGYRYPGVIVSVFTTRAGLVRYVVECTAPGCEGMLHIFNGEQLALAHRPK